MAQRLGPLLMVSSNPLNGDETLIDAAHVFRYSHLDYTSPLRLRRPFLLRKSSSKRRRRLSMPPTGSESLASGLCRRCSSPSSTGTTLGE